MGKIYGLVGEKLGHSFSPQIHTALGGYEYGLFPMEKEELVRFFEKKEFDGVNVTIPYKQTVMPYLDRISDEAQAIGSVNTVVKEKDGTLSGYNTDIFGFMLMLKKGKIEVAGKKALVLGSGGSSKTAVYALKQLGARSVTVISRGGEDNYENLEKHADAQVIINTTPLGMYPKNGVSAVDLSRFPRLTGVADLIYNPEKTAFLLQAEKLGISHIGGLYMLVAQAARASEYFIEKSYTVADIDCVFEKINSSMRNITLVGMPGCGKSTIGRLLADMLGRECVDCDEYFEKKHRCSPAFVIENEGEQVFRRMESEVLAELSALCGLVLCTGGGVVTVPENHELLRQNGRVVFINRDISSLATAGRPLSQGGITALEKMYEVRLPLYRAVCDIEVELDSSRTATENAERLLGILGYTRI